VTVLVDSDVLDEVSRGKDQKVLSRWTELSQSEVTILVLAGDRRRTLGGRATARVGGADELISSARVCSD